MMSRSARYFLNNADFPIMAAALFCFAPCFPVSTPKLSSKGVFFWSLLAFTRKHRESELHSRVILNINVQGSLYKHPCITYTQQTSSLHRTIVATSRGLCECSGVWTAQLQILWPKRYKYITH